MCASGVNQAVYTKGMKRFVRAETVVSVLYVKLRRNPQCQVRMWWMSNN